MSSVEQVLVFGEDPHDTAAVMVLVEGLRTDLLGAVAVRTRRQPITLVKNLGDAKRRSRSKDVAAVVRADAVRGPVRACVFHEDTDAVEDSHVALAAVIRATYAGCGAAVVTAVAAWELEAWWYLFPDAVASVRSSWSAPSRYRGRDVGQIESPKEELRRDVRPAGTPLRGRFREYREADSEDIARAVVQGGWLPRPAGRSASWNAFVAQVAAL